MGFVEMGIVADYVTDMDTAKKFTLMILADRADGKDRTDGKAECWPSVRELMRRTCQSKSTVLRKIAELRNIGIITVEKRWRLDESGQARQTTNKYIIDIPGILARRYQGPASTTPVPPVDNSMGVTVTPIPENDKTPGQSMGLNLTPKEEYGCQKPPSMGVTDDTPMKDQQKYQPSPSLPLHGDDDRTDLELDEVPTPANHDAHDEEPTSAPTPADPLADEIPSVEEHSTDSPADEEDAALGDLRADWELIYAALPTTMHGLPPREVPAIAEMIRLRLRCGWTPGTLRKVLGARLLPSEIRHLPGLVKARLREDTPPHNAPPHKPASKKSAQHSPYRASGPRPDELLTPE